MSHICDSPVWIVPVASVDCGLLGLTSVQSPAKLVVRVILIPAIGGTTKNGTSDTSKLPAPKLTTTGSCEPANSDGFGLLPVTVILNELRGVLLRIN